MVSGLGRLVMETFWEKVLQPVVAGLIMAGNDLERVNDPENDDDRPLANGQFILVREDAYRAVDGHAAVKTDVLDDVGMASAIKGAGYPYNLIFMRDLFSCRMYTNLSEALGRLDEEHVRRDALLAGEPRCRDALRHLDVSGAVPLACLGLYSGSAEWTAWGGGISAVVQLVRLWLDIQVGQDPKYGPTQPFAVVMLLVLLAHSGIRAKRGTAAWKGRQVPIIKYADQDDVGSDST